jgi:colicin import membrane protein
MSAQTELAAVPPKETALQVFQSAKGLDPYLAKIREEIDAFVPDVSSRKGREAIASIAYKVARSKTALDNVGKDLVAELKEIPKKIDAERKRVRDTLDAWQEEVRRPLTEWQAAEDARVDKHNDRLTWLKTMTDDLGELNSLEIKGFIQSAEAVEIGKHWEEFEPEAAREKDKVLTALRAALAKREQFEAEQAELARLRTEAAQREQKEREERIAREAAERARQEAEQKAQAERDAAARREQEAKATAERRELEQKLRAEQAERAAEQAKTDRIAAEQRAVQERENAARRAEEAAEQARQDERRRADAAAAEIIRQQDERERDEAHRRTINRAALEAFIAGGMPEACAKQAVTLIALRKIPNINIQY